MKHLLKSERAILTAAISTRSLYRLSHAPNRAGLWNRTTPLYWNNTACTITPYPHENRKLL